MVLNHDLPLESPGMIVKITDILALPAEIINSSLVDTRHHIFKNFIDDSNVQLGLRIAALFFCLSHCRTKIAFFLIYGTPGHSSKCKILKHQFQEAPHWVM